MAHEHAPWRKLVLIPCWTFQLFFLLVEIILLAAVLSSLDVLPKDVGASTLGKATHIGVALWIAICSIMLLFSIIEIVLLDLKHLKPLIFVIMNTFKTTLWTAWFLIDMVSFAKSKPEIVAIVGASIEGVLLASFWVPFIYGCVVYHRCRNEQKSYRQVHMSEHQRNSSHTPKSTLADVELQELYDDIPAAPADTGTPPTASYNYQRANGFETYR
ncbi:uncharacterized protein BP5553_06705 [Venustampulla echinocandica]|uniref:MARVEL domain-containing protein n=1 Tax=Venustampulla echinocandica TaxID=2656787 RepID=A0A370TKN8_9HELO|nr:uncharacterized protein BP5553_06705 [Venustampulla echinocandica]RDL36093.1 hypothetical protein BP5553_06705 [Venustampulla echinocandica]